MTDTNDYLAIPESGQGPGVLVLHAWWGLTDFVKDVCNQLAGQGYVALAPDLYDGVTTADGDKADGLASQYILAEETLSLLRLATEKLRTHSAVTKPQIGVVGFSLGGFWALELVAKLEPEAFKAVVLFYANRPGIEQQQYAEASAAFLGHFAEDDEFEPFEEVLQTQEKIQQAGKKVTFHRYPGTGHWFVESNVPDAYNADAAQLAWERTFEFLKQKLS